MYRVIRSTKKVCGSDADRIRYSDDAWEWLATKDVTDSDGFVTDYSLYRNRDTGLYVCIFGDKDLYRPGETYYDFETENEQEAWEWFDSYNGFEDDEDDIYGAIDLSDEDRDKLDEISNRCVTSNPVSGDWDTEVKHEQAAIAKELGVSMQQAKQIMIDELGFEEDQF